ncbi:MAG: glycosyltransferase family 4 protein, partial [Burkholderiales bacterium]
MPTIYINGYFLTQKTSGVQRFALNLLSHIDELLAANKANIKVICLVPQAIKSSFKLIQIKIIKSKINLIDTKQTLWEQLVLPFVCGNALLLNLCNFAPLLKQNQLVVLHDVIPFRYPESCSKLWGSLFRLMSRIFARRVKLLATVSHFSAQEIIKVTQVSRKIMVLGNSGEHFKTVVEDNSVLNRLNLQSGSYILAVSSQAQIIHKNFAILSQLAGQINTLIVAVGNGESNSSIKYTGRISDAELKALYANAWVFIFPSLYEGFGIPPLEAMTCGAPVMVADIPVLKEVCANGALYFQPTALQDVIAKLDHLKAHPELRLELINEGYQRVKHYSWANLA